MFFFYLGQSPAPFSSSLINFQGMAQTFIATSSPNSKSCDKFWLTVQEKRALVIINLTSLDNTGGYYGEEQDIDYWPSDENQPKVLGNGIKIELLHTEQIGSLLKR